MKHGASNAVFACRGCRLCGLLPEQVAPQRYKECTCSLQLYAAQELQHKATALTATLHERHVISCCSPTVDYAKCKSC